MASTTLSTTILPSTSSLVTEVLATAVRLEKEDLDAKLGKLSKRTEEVKVKVYNALQEKYIDFYPNLNTAEELGVKVKTTVDDMQQVAEKVENEIKAQLSNSTAEFQDLSTQLAEATTILAVLDKLLKIHVHLQTVDQAIKTREFTKAVSNLQVVHELLQTKSISQENEIKIITALHQDYLVREGKLRYDIGETWSECIRWNLSKPDEVELCITNKQELKEVLSETVQALNNMGELTAKLQLFGERFLKHFVTALLMNPNACLRREAAVTAIETKPSSERKTRVVTLSLHKLEAVMVALNTRFLGVQVNTCEGDDEEMKVTLMELFGKCISSDFLTLVVEQCLAHSVPSNKEELSEYHNQVVQPTRFFQNKLTQLGFIKESNTVLIDFVGNVDVMFANKKTQEILEKARSLMSSDIHNMVKISAEMPFGELPPLGLEGASAKKAKAAENIATKSSNVPLSANTFKLPTCYISLWVQTLMQLVYETLHEASDSNPKCATQLFYSVRNIFELFCSVVPTYHKDALTTLPQLSALHHNNCMYIAHHLLTLGHQFRPKLPEDLAELVTFVDLVPKLRRLGTHCLLQQMVRQRNQLLDCLSSAQGFINVSEDDNFSRSERAIKQTLHQLHHLGKVWKPVLPHSIYCKTIGTLLNSAVLELTTTVVGLEDISADDATQLATVLSILTAKAPELFKVEDDNSEAESSPTVLLHKHVAKWNKLKELMLLLNASLQDIADRWADGKGPLAAEFGSNDVKQLIRALFQNTDRRAAVLGKIK